MFIILTFTHTVTDVSVVNVFFWPSVVIDFHIRYIFCIFISYAQCVFHCHWYTNHLLLLCCPSTVDFLAAAEYAYMDPLNVLDTAENPPEKCRPQ